ncbi:MAG TPA: site-specific integrase [Candidatus Dormibacteraeota bacterium]|nr:site-specific integrase [Candidatus Dormibacteraeota bacterium]
METVEAVLVESPEPKPQRRSRRNPRGIFERKPGMWWIRYIDAQGRYRREKAGTKGMAIELYRKRKTEALAGKKLPEKLRRATVSFAEIARDALAYSKANKRSYEDDVVRIEPMLGWWRERAADSIMAQEAERRLGQAAEENGWSPATVNRYRSLLSLVYRLAIRNDKAADNPARLVAHRQEPTGRIRFLSAEEEVRLRAVIEAECPEHMPELELALHTGLRRSEQYGLTWENVNLARRVLTIPRSKNGLTRHVPLNGPALAALGELRKRSDGTGPVMRNLQGEPLASSRHWFEPAMRHAKLRAFSWHCLRHTFASRLVMAGVDIRTVQELMGHRSILMTVRYSHLSPQHTLAAVERLAGSVPATPTDTTTDTRPPAPIQPEAAYVQ